MNRTRLLATMLTLAATPAFAHAFLKTAFPPVGGSVKASPTEVSITFTEAIEPRFSTITVQDAAGTTVDTGSLHAASDVQLAVGVKPLLPGPYKVIWHATATDSHKTEGNFVFTVAQ